MNRTDTDIIAQVTNEALEIAITILEHAQAKCRSFTQPKLIIESQEAYIMKLAHAARLVRDIKERPL